MRQTLRNAQRVTYPETTVHADRRELAGEIMQGILAVRNAMPRGAGTETKALMSQVLQRKYQTADTMAEMIIGAVRVGVSLDVALEPAYRLVGFLRGRYGAHAVRPVDELHAPETEHEGALNVLQVYRRPDRTSGVRQRMLATIRSLIGTLQEMELAIMAEEYGAQVTYHPPRSAA